MQLSIVVPIYNEADLIQQLYQRIFTSAESMSQDFELIFIDDGSTDSSLGKLLLLKEADKRVKVISFTKNFGHQAAYMAGMKHAKGEYIVAIDGDLQDPPELIPEMYNKMIAEKLDVVVGKRKSRKEKFVKRTLIKLFHKLFSRLTGFENIESTGNFSMYSREAINALNKFDERIKYIPALREHIGFKQSFIMYDRDARASGEAKMTYPKLFALAIDAIFSSTKLPIRICLIMGLLGVTIFFGVGVYVIIAKIVGFAVLGWSSTLLSLYFIGFVQLTFLGVLGEYVFRIYKESQNRPSYFINKTYDDDEVV